MPTTPVAADTATAIESPLLDLKQMRLTIAADYFAYIFCYYQYHKKRFTGLLP
jgi:hypothetical protein